MLRKELITFFLYISLYTNHESDFKLLFKLEMKMMKIIKFVYKGTKIFCQPKSHTYST